MFPMSYHRKQRVLFRPKLLECLPKTFRLLENLKWPRGQGWSYIVTLSLPTIQRKVKFLVSVGDKYH